jgi:hypothetical protein
MSHVVKAYDPDTYVDAYGQVEWKNFVANEYHFLTNNKKWDLVLE